MSNRPFIPSASCGPEYLSWWVKPGFSSYKNVPEILLWSNQNVMSLTSKFFFSFFIFAIIWRVPHTSYESRTRLDELQVSLSYMFVPLTSNWKDNFIIIVIWRKNLPWIVLWCPFPREVVWSICVYQSWDIFSVFLHITKYYYQYQYKYHLLHSPLFSLFLSLQKWIR